MPKSYLNPANLEIQLRNLFADDPPRVAELGENWDLYRLGPGLFRAVRTLTDAQIKTLPGTAVVLVPAPGVGKILHFLSASMILNATAGAYTNLSANCKLDFSYGTDFFLPGMAANYEEATSGALADNSDVHYIPFSGRSYAESENAITQARWENEQTYISNQGIVLRGTNTDGSFEGGNPANRMKVTVFCATEDILS